MGNIFMICNPGITWITIVLLKKELSHGIKQN